MELELPDRNRVVPYQKAQLDIPNDGLVVAAAGRYVKFQEPKFWKALIELLDDCPQLYFVGIGIEETQLPFLSSMLSAEIKRRIRFLKWQGAEYLRVLSSADIVLDTFPSGGGTVLLDAMALGIPVVTFRNNYLRLYDQTDWSPGEEDIDEDELVVQRGDFEQMKRVVVRLASDEEYRRAMGERVKKYIHNKKGSPSRAVQECESVYRRIIESTSGSDRPIEVYGAEVRELLRSRERIRKTPAWIIWAAQQLRRVLRKGERVLDRIA